MHRNMAHWSSPLPILPYSFPSLAVYLHSELVNSQKAADSSCVKRLSTIVVNCYGAEEGSGAEVGSESFVGRKGVGGLLAKVRGKKEKRGNVGNEQTCDLITPLRLDDWG
jgi:hypothetical protein